MEGLGQERKDHQNNIVLIGMPGSGKSTVGVVLAKRMGLRFLDCDLLIQERTGLKLHEILEQRGLEGFLAVENQINSTIDVSDSVIATGGSAVYGTEAMEHLRHIGRIVYLMVSYEELGDRLGDLHQRGVAMRKGQTLAELYRERIPLYERYADLTVPCDGRRVREVVEELTDRL